MYAFWALRVRLLAIVNQKAMPNLKEAYTRGLTPRQAVMEDFLED